MLLLACGTPQDSPPPVERSPPAPLPASRVAEGPAVAVPLHATRAPDEGDGRREVRCRTHEGHPPHVRVESLDVRGALAKPVVRRILGRHINELIWCYEEALIRQRGLHGRLQLAFAVDETGRAGAVEVTGSEALLATKMGGCIAEGVRRWTFPGPGQGAAAGVQVALSIELPEAEAAAVPAP